MSQCRLFCIFGRFLYSNRPSGTEISFLLILPAPFLFSVNPLRPDQTRQTNHASHVCSVRPSVTIFTQQYQANSTPPHPFSSFLFSSPSLYFLTLSDGVTANVGAVHRSPLYTRALSPKRAFSRAWSAKWRRTWSRSSSAWRAGMRWMRAHIFSRASSLWVVVDVRKKKSLGKGTRAKK